MRLWDRWVWLLARQEKARAEVVGSLAVPWVGAGIAQRRARARCLCSLALDALFRYHLGHAGTPRAANSAAASTSDGVGADAWARSTATACCGASISPTVIQGGTRQSRVTP